MRTPRERMLPHDLRATLGGNACSSQEDRPRRRSAGTRDASLPAKTMGKNRGRVLVIEQDDAIRSTIEWLLADHGFEVSAARTCDDAMATGDRTGLDLVLSDILLPGGPDAAIEMAGRLGARVLFMSSHGDQPLARRAMRGERVWLLPKPFTPDALFRTLQAVLDA